MKKFDILFLFIIILLMRLEIQANNPSISQIYIGVETFQSPLLYLWDTGSYNKETGMTSKVCKKCKKEKPLNEFYEIWNKQQQKYYYRKVCKECEIKDSKKYYSKHKKEIQQYREEHRTERNEKSKLYRNSHKEEISKKAKIYYKSHKEKILKRSKKYNQTEKGRIVQKKQTKKYRKNNPLKYKAHRVLNSAIKIGEIIRQPCEICGNPKSEGHHEDYSKPLEVIWLCRKCHRKLHKRNY